MPSEVVDRLILATNEGVDTLFVEELADERLFLHWLVAGHVEPFDIWVIAQVTADEARHIVNDRPAIDLFLAEKAGLPVLVRLGPRDGSPVVSVEVLLAGEAVDECWAIDQLLPKLDAMAQSSDVDLPEHPTPTETIRALCHA